ncbi:TIGR02234 family membrane protein [Streptomyces spongiicola]|uniref:TIGR02234 family membrane protein n=1 Tax=Streptomyces spongiicola TaxID=1690221 RepID=A0A2S1YVF5_9ACTN|nr:TIGR02234 family membrane protein [Streptomyces spongiicola]AWK08046.1 TIGR02234 family membrane protein [Streptomyces spongiicola]GBQ01186.1 TIGR02234 family membrane protein [Streptomyces spongiicola]
MTAVPVTQSGAETERTARAAARGRRSLAAALLLGAVGAAAVLLASGQTWAEGTAAVGAGSVPIRADGRGVTGLPAALAVVGLAALVAVFAVRRAGRAIVSALLALSGAGAAAAAFLGARDSAALDERARQTTGDTAAAAAELTHTAWPYVTGLAGLLILAAGLLALRYGASWPAMSGRYEREGGAPRGGRPATADPDRPEELWKALDRGEDPTGDR